TWNQVSTGEVKVWLLNSNADVTASKEERVLTEDVDIKSFDKGKALNRFEDAKKKSLGILGIKNWKIESYKWHEGKEDYKLSVTGSYTNAQKEKIHFLETHIYKKRNVVQYLHTWPSSFSDGLKVANEFLKHQIP